MTKDELDALVKAGERLAEIVNESVDDCQTCDGTGTPYSGLGDESRCGACSPARDALSSWRAALADLRAEEQPGPVPGDGRDVILDLVETCDCERYDRTAKKMVDRADGGSPEARIANLLGWRKCESLTTAAILAHLQGKTLRPVLLARREVGIATYKHPLHPGDVPALEYALDEAADLPIYLHQGELERTSPTVPAPTPEPSRVLCPICSPGRCRCEEGRR